MLLLRAEVDEEGEPRVRSILEVMLDRQPLAPASMLSAFVRESEADEFGEHHSLASRRTDARVHETDIPKALEVIGSGDGESFLLAAELGKRDAVQAAAGPQILGGDEARCRGCGFTVDCMAGICH